MFRLPVDIFFIISGFLITGTLLYEQIPLKTFLIKRALRVLPLYFFIIALVHMMNQFVPPYDVKTNKIVFDSQILTLDRVAEDGTRYLHDGKGVRIKAEAGELQNKRVVRFLYEDGTLRVVSFDIGEKVFNGEIGARFKVEFGPVFHEKTLQSRNPEETSYLRFFLFTYNLVPFSKMTPQLSHLWFVSAIAQCYLFYGLLVFVVGRFITDPEKKRRFFFFFLLLLTLLISIYRYYKFGTTTHIVFRMDVFFVGCILKLAERSFMENKGLFWDYVFPGSLFALGFMTISYIACNWHAVPNNPLLFALSYLAFGSMIFGTLKKNKAFGAVLENPILRWIGKYSFGIYLWHPPFLWLFVITRNYMHSNVLSIAICVFFSIIIGALLEKLFNKASASAMSKLSTSLP